MAGTPTKLVLALLGEFARDLGQAHTINQLALSTGKAYANIHAAVSRMLNERILTKETVGHSHQCRLNLQNARTSLYLGLLQAKKRDDLLKASPDARRLLREIDRLAAELGILLVWKSPERLLLITGKKRDASANFPGSTSLTLKEFLGNKDLVEKIGRDTLLFGHAFYVSTLHQKASVLEVFG